MAITFSMSNPVSLSVVVQELHGIPEVRRVVEIPSTDRVDPNLIRKTATLPKPPNECSKTVCIELGTA